MQRQSTAQFVMAGMILTAVMSTGFGQTGTNALPEPPRVPTLPGAKQTGTTPTAPAATSPTTPAKPKYDFAEVTKAGDAIVKALELPGAALIIVKDDAPVFEHYFGTYTKDTVVPIASASKWLSGATIMSLVDAKTLDLDAPIGNMLPEFAADKVGATKAGLTVRQLFSHTSGYADEPAGAQRPGITMEKASQLAAGEKLLFTPGTSFRYGGVGMQVAAHIAETVTGKPWRDVFAEKIATPLGMDSTQYGRLGVGRNPNVAGGASSSAPEYMRFLRMILNKGEVDGVRVLSPESVAVMTSVQSGEAKAGLGRAARGLSANGYGIGCWIDKAVGADGAPVAPDQLAGAGVVVSSPGAFGFHPYIDRERNMAVVWMIEDRGRARKRVDRTTLPDLRGEIAKAIDAPLDLP